MNQYETVHDIIADRERLRAECDALREALEMMLAGTEPSAGRITMPTASAVRAAYAALAARETK